MQHLLIIEDDKGKRAVSLHADSGSIGRDVSNSIVLHSKEVSRQHAILLRVTHPGAENHGFRIIDGNLQGKPSTNGLFINGRRSSSHNLRHGDEIIFGGNVKARYQTATKKEDINWLLSGGAEAEKYMATLIAAPVDLSATPNSDKLEDAAIARLASFPELFSHPIIEISLTGELTYLNPAAVNQFPTINLAKLSHPILTDVIDTVQTQEKKRFVRNITVDDQIFEQALHYIPQSDLIRCYLVDITDRKRAETELQALHDDLEAQVKERTTQVLATTEQLKQEQIALQSSYATNRALLNAIPDPMFRISATGEFVNFSEPKQHKLPFSPASCLNQHLADVLPTVAEEIQQCIERALTTAQIEVLEFQLSVEHEICHFEARIVSSADQEVMMIIRDITEQKRREAEIRKTLERERELNEMKTRFVSMTSHEFRTPLTTILSSAELLEHYGERWDKTKQHQYLHKIQTAATHMTELLNDVLLINKAEAGRVEFTPQPLVLNEFCQEIIEELQITTTQHHLELRSQLSHTPHQIDRKLMRHILTNLLSNAINYSPSGGDIVVGMSTTDEQLKLWVQDHGIGIPEDARPTLFDSFVRGSNVGTISGTGLGLAIIQKSVNLHQGEITFDSTVGEGTTFTVTLPVIPLDKPMSFSGNLVEA